MEPVGRELGPLLITHPVANRRHWSTGGTALAFGVGGALLMAILIGNPDLVSGRGLAYALIPTLAGFPVAAVQLTRAVRSGRNETFELYENGIARHASDVRQSWTWAQVAVLRVHADTMDPNLPAPPYVGWFRRLGWTYRCTVRFTDGATVRVDGYTTDALVLGETLLARRPDAVPAANPNRHRWLLLGLTPLATVGFAVGVVLCFRYLNGNSATDTSGSVAAALAITMIVCVVGFVLSLTVFLMSLVAFLKQRS